MTRTDSKPEGVDWAAIIGVIATVSVFAMAQGLSYPLLSFILHREGVSTSMIGLSAAMTPIGFVLSSPLIPRLARRFGAARVALTCAVLSALVLGLIALFQQPYTWLALRFLLGVVTNPLYVLSEVWMIALAPPARRGRMMGIYTTVISAGFAAGPLCLLLVGTQGLAPFLVGITGFIVCGTCLAMVVRRLPEVHDGGEQVSVLGFMPLAPLLLFAVMVAAGFEQGALALLPVYGVYHGIEEARMSGLLSVMIAGNIAMQVPLGMLAERLGANRVRLVCVALTILGCALLPALIQTPAIWAMVFVWGAVSYGIYTMTLIELGARFSGSMLVAGNAAFSLVWGVGGVAVPPTAGTAMDLLGAPGMPLTFGSLCVFLLAASLLSRRGWQKV